MSASFTFHRSQGSLKCFLLSSPPPGPHTQLILHFSQLKWPSLELSPLFYTLHQELMFQYADTGYTFQSGMLHVYFISENSLAVKMCVKRLATKLCICCLFCPGSIRHLFCTEILIKLFHFSLFFSHGVLHSPHTHTLFFSLPSFGSLGFPLFSSGVTPLPGWGGRPLFVLGIIHGTQGKENRGKINWLRKNKNRTSHVTGGGWLRGAPLAQLSTDRGDRLKVQLVVLTKQKASTMRFARL